MSLTSSFVEPLAKPETEDYQPMQDSLVDFYNHRLVLPKIK